MKVITVAILLVAVNLISADDDFLQLIQRAGYVGEAHQVETVDGYLLKVHRILPEHGKRQLFPVLLMHGVITTSADYVITGPKIALAYYLADAGYDVWLGNARGSKHSMKHRNLSTESPEFWNFSFHEIGLYDLPAMIDYMLHTTESSKTFYVGHSQGGAAFLVCMSMLPKYNEKITQAHLLAPVSFQRNMPHPLMRAIAAKSVNGLFGNMSYINMKPMWNYSKMFCNGRQKSFTTALCVSFVLAIVGPNKNGVELDERILKTLLSHISPRISVNQFVHFTQLMLSKNFESFDYRWGNFKHYNSSGPVRYALENVISLVYIYGGSEDALVSRIVGDIKFKMQLFQKHLFPFSGS